MELYSWYSSHESTFITVLFTKTLFITVKLLNIPTLFTIFYYSYWHYSLFIYVSISSYFLSFFLRRQDSGGTCQMLNIKWNTSIHLNSFMPTLCNLLTQIFRGEAKEGGRLSPPDIEGKSPYGFFPIAKALEINDIIFLKMGISTRRVQISQYIIKFNHLLKFENKIHTGYFHIMRSAPDQNHGFTRTNIQRISNCFLVDYLLYESNITNDSTSHDSSSSSSSPSLSPILFWTMFFASILCPSSYAWGERILSSLVFLPFLPLFPASNFACHFN